MSNYDLSIVVLTYNRAEQLAEALSSCLGSTLPEKTEFVIIDNASTDNTEETVKNVLQNSGYDFIYNKQDYNTGVGPGRNIGYECASGKVVYFMDDDAVIPEECKSEFFVKALRVMSNNEKVASITTKIKDIVLGYDRHPDLAKKNEIAGYPQIFMYHGGSHFLRNGVFDKPLYMPIKYGFEEIYPSLRVFDQGFMNLYCDDIYIVHKPKKNKWQEGSDERKRIDIINCYVPYVVKKRFYPKTLRPILWLFYRLRVYHHLRKYVGAKKESKLLGKSLFTELLKDKSVKKIRIRTVVKATKLFGLTVV